MTSDRSLPPAHLATSSWEALGTRVVLRLCDPAAMARARGAVECDLAAIDLACSRFRPDSELTRVNAHAGRRPVKVSALLLEALALALRAAELTDGGVDPTVGRALELAGYDRDWLLLEPPAEAPESDGGEMALAVRSIGGWRTVAVDHASQTVRLPAGIALDLGATAKAWAADRAASIAASAGGCGSLVSIGGDIATRGPAPSGGWRIHVTDDHRDPATAPGQRVAIRSGGLATSSTAVRRWSHAGRTMHHIIDPRTGSPVRQSWRTVSVAAASCAEANIAATAALVRPARAAAWLAELGLPARLLAWDGAVTAVGDWPAERALAA